MAVALPFVQSSPAVFWTLYLLCGLSDVLDGAVARSTGTVSLLGEKLDTIADIIFEIWRIINQLRYLPAGQSLSPHRTSLSRSEGRATLRS